jgi:hypothetical protein
MRLDSQHIWLNIKGKAFTLGLRAGLHCKLNGARNLVRVHDLETLLAFCVLSCNQGAKPEEPFKRCENARSNDGLGVE